MNRLILDLKLQLASCMAVFAIAGSPALGVELILRLNPGTGAATINNTAESPDVSIDAYSITSATPILKVSGWTSFGDAGQAGWLEANAAANHLSETSLAGSRTLVSGATIGLGSPYVGVTEFGQSPTSTPVQFTYHIDGNVTVTGVVEYETFINTMVLQVDSVTGQAQILNPSNFDARIDGYSITSVAGSLDSTNWNSFAQDGQAGWEESNPTAKHLTETNLTGTRLFEKLEQSPPIEIGQIFNGGTQDLQFTIHAITGGASGDYNSDGEVNLADYTVWRDNLGAPAGTLPNDPLNSVIGTAQYQTWKTNFGSTGGGTSATYTGVVQYVSLSGSLVSPVPVPEPTSWLIACSAIAFLGFRQSRDRA